MTMLTLRALRFPSRLARCPLRTGLVEERIECKSPFRLRSALAGFSPLNELWRLRRCCLEKLRNGGKIYPIMYISCDVPMGPSIPDQHPISKNEYLIIYLDLIQKRIRFNYDQ